MKAKFVNLSRAVEVEVTAETGVRRIDRMGVDIATALHARPEIHRLADRLARVIVPLAITLAVLTLLLGLAAGLPGEAAGLRALSVLVIACPCAVAIAVPVSHLAATGAAAAGIHFRTQTASERLGAVRRVLFDKTGTLTEGRSGVRLRPGLDRARALALAAAAEYEVAHPVARSLREAGGGVNRHRVGALRRGRAGDGQRGGGAGREPWLPRPKRVVPPEGAAGAGLSTVHMAIGNDWAATFLLGDAPRPDAAATLARLRRSGLGLGMASGVARGNRDLAQGPPRATTKPLLRRRLQRPGARHRRLRHGPAARRRRRDGGEFADGHRQRRPAARGRRRRIKERNTMTEHAISRFSVPKIEDLPDDVRARILAVQEKSGFVPNVFLTLAHRPEEFRAFFAYHDALMDKPGPITKAEREMIVVATSNLNQCQYCVVAHGAILRVRVKNPRIADQVAVNYRKADITERQKAMLDFAVKVSQRAYEVGDEDVETLRAHGFTEDDVWDIAAIAAFFAMSNRLANATDMRPNDEFYALGR